MKMKDANVVGLIATAGLALLVDPVLLWLLITLWPTRFVSAWLAVVVYYSAVALVLTTFFVLYLLRSEPEPPAPKQAGIVKEAK